MKPSVLFAQQSERMGCIKIAAGVEVGVVHSLVSKAGVLGVMEAKRMKNVHVGVVVRHDGVWCPLM